MSDLFSHAAEDRLSALAPLADRMRPRTLDEVIGQPQIASANAALRKQIDAGHVPNFLLIGSPGSGKTTIARIVADAAGMALHELSAVACGLADVRAVITQAKERLGAHGKQTILFLDEIHRFNKAQQDALLPSVEAGTIRLIGATTENPYSSIIRALLSRMIVYKLRALQPTDISLLLSRALSDSDRGLARNGKFELTPAADELIVSRCGGDARAALTLLETAAFVSPHVNDSVVIDIDSVEQASDRRRIDYDKTGIRHSDSISAYIKSMRAGNSEDALLYLAAMSEGGEDPMFIARRLAIFASEDIGPADPQALVLAHAALGITAQIGFPEAAITLAHVTRYCAEAPKSRQAVEDIGQARELIHSGGSPDIPLHLTQRAKAAH